MTARLGRLERVLLVLIVAAGLGVLANRMSVQPLDLKVYIAGGDAIVHGRDVYAAQEASTGLRFTYTPFAALLAAPVSLFPYYMALLLWTAATTACVAVTVRRLMLASGVGAPTVARLLPAIVLLGLLTEPISQTLAFGQVNVFLVCAVVVGALDTPRSGWTRALLIGAAAAIKLTPLIFVPYLFLIGDRRLAAKALAAFAAITAVAWAVLPGESTDYWLHLSHDTSRIGNSEYMTNQSWAGLFARLQGLHQPSGPLYQLVVVVTLVVGLAVAADVGARDAPQGLVLAGLTGLLVSPISWSHHWVWLALLPLLWCLQPSARRLVLAAAVLVVVLLAPFHRVPHDNELEWTWNAWQTLVGNCYVIVAALLLLEALVTADRGFLRRTTARLDPRVPRVDAPAIPATASR